MEMRNCVTRNNVSWQTVPQPSTGSSKRLVSNMNAEQRQTAADLWTKPSDLSYRSACNSAM